MLDNMITEYIGDDLDRVETAESDVKHGLMQTVSVLMLSILMAVGIVAITYMIALSVAPETPMKGFMEGMAAVAAAGLGGLLTVSITALAVWDTIRKKEEDVKAFWDAEGQIDYNPDTNGDRYE